MFNKWVWLYSYFNRVHTDWKYCCALDWWGKHFEGYPSPMSASVSIQIPPGPLLGILIHGCHILKDSKFYGCQATVLKGSCKNSRVPLHRSSKFYGCQAPVAPVLTRALIKFRYVRIRTIFCFQQSTVAFIWKPYAVSVWTSKSIEALLRYVIRSVVRTGATGAWHP